VSLFVLNGTTHAQIRNVNYVLVRMGREDSDWPRGLSAWRFKACGQIRWENRARRTKI